MIKRNNQSFTVLHYWSLNNLSHYKILLSYADDNLIKDLFQEKAFFSVLFIYSNLFDIFLDRLIVAKKSGIISTTDIQESINSKHRESDFAPSVYLLSYVSYYLMSGNKEIVRKLLELNGDLVIEEFPRRFFDLNINTARYYVEEIKKSEKDLDHIKVEHLVFEDLGDEVDKVKKIQTQPEDFERVDEIKRFTGFLVINTKTQQKINILTFNIYYPDIKTKSKKDIDSLKIAKKLIDSNQIDQLIINMDLPFESGYHRSTLFLTKDQEGWKGSYHNPNGYYLQEKFDQKFENESMEIIKELELPIESVSQTELIIPNDAFGSCSIIGSIVSAVKVLGETCVDKIRKRCQEIIESDQYKTFGNYKKGKCIGILSQGWNEAIRKKLSEKLLQIKQQMIAQQQDSLPENIVIIRGHNGIVSEVELGSVDRFNYNSTSNLLIEKSNNQPKAMELR